MFKAGAPSDSFVQFAQDSPILQSDSGIESSVESGFLSDTPNLPIYSIGLILASIFFLAYLYTELKFQYRCYFFNKCNREVEDAPNALSSDSEGKLIYLVGKLQVHGPCFLSDPLLPFVESTSSIMMKRSVEMMQWQSGKSKKKVLKWVKYQVKNQGNKENPIWDPRLENKTFEQEYDIQIFPYKISKDTAKMIPITGVVRNSNVNTSRESDCCILKGYQIYSDCLYYYLSKRRETNFLPQAGDYRIKYFSLELGSYATVLGEYSQGSIKKYRNKLLFAESGIVSMDKIMYKIQRQEAFRQKIMRFLFAAGIVSGIILAST